MVVQSIYRVSRGGQIKFKLYWQFAEALPLWSTRLMKKWGKILNLQGKKKRKKILKNRNLDFLIEPIFLFSCHSASRVMNIPSLIWASIPIEQELKIQTFNFLCLLYFLVDRKKTVTFVTSPYTIQNTNTTTQFESQTKRFHIN